PAAGVVVVARAAIVAAPFAGLRRRSARRARLADRVAVRDLVVPDDVRAVARHGVLRREVIDELRARGILLFGVRLIRVADVLDANRALVVPKVPGVPGGRLFGDE